MSVRAASMPATCLRCPCLRPACGIAVDAGGAGVLPAGRENPGGIPHGFLPGFLRIGQPPPGSELRGEVETDILEVLLCEREPVARVGEEDVAAVLVDGHVGVLAALEIGQLLGVVAVDPAGFVDRDRYWMTSNWSAPTVPMILRPLSEDTNSCATPSSISWSTPLASCLNFSGSAFSM